MTDFKKVLADVRKEIAEMTGPDMMEDDDVLLYMKIIQMNDDELVAAWKATYYVMFILGVGDCSCSYENRYYGLLHSNVFYHRNNINKAGLEAWAARHKAWNLAMINKSEQMTDKELLDEWSVLDEQYEGILRNELWYRKISIEKG